MGAIVRQVTEEGIKPQDMKSGDVAVVVSGNSYNIKVGEVVQRANERLVYVGKSEFWGCLNKAPYPDFKVKVLPPGSIIELT